MVSSPDKYEQNSGVFRLLLAVMSLVAGAGVGFGFAPYNVWPLTIIGFAVLAIVIWNSKKIWGAAGYGFLFGLGFLVIGLNWMSAIFMDAMFALIIAEAFFYLCLGVMIKVAQRVTWWPIIAAISLTGVEYVFSRFPFEGFGWMRLGYSMIDSPLANAYPIVGVAGVGFLTGLLAWVLACVVIRVSFRSILAVTLGVLLAACVAIAGSGIQPQPALNQYQVGWVQGGAPGGGIYGLGEARTITQNETIGTQALADDVAAGKYPIPDFVVWPENGTDLDLRKDEKTKVLIQQALDTIKRPLLVGTILQGPGENERQTASLLLSTDGSIQQQYVKRGIVPFGEWIPYRDFFLPLIPRLSYVGRQSVPGLEPGVLSVPLGALEPLKLGVLVCYDVAFDQYVYDTARFGSELLVVQSSNAMYQGTGQIEQQFAITRARAAELRQEILVVTTSGISGFIDARGNVVNKITDPGEAHGVLEITSRKSDTPALWLAPALEFVFALASVVALIAVPIMSRRTQGKGR